MKNKPYTIAQVIENLRTIAELARKDPQWCANTARNIITRGIQPTPKKSKA